MDGGVEAGGCVEHVEGAHGGHVLFEGDVRVVGSLVSEASDTAVAFSYILNACVFVIIVMFCAKVPEKFG